jgi:uncharacterized membrane protein
MKRKVLLFGVILIGVSHAAISGQAADYLAKEDFIKTIRNSALYRYMLVTGQQNEKILNVGSMSLSLVNQEKMLEALNKINQNLEMNNKLVSRFLNS